MGKKILDSKALYIFLSILISVVLWFYVTSLDGNEQNETIRNIPVMFTGTDILEDRGLMIVGSVPTATVEVRATPAVLAKLSNETVSVSVNVSQITEASEYKLAYTINLPAGVSQSDVEFISGQTGNVTFKVVRFIAREVEIVGEFVGTVANGYLAGDNDEFIFAPKTILISGQADFVNQVDHILVSVGGENLTDPVSGEYPYKLIGVDGSVLTDLEVNCSEETVYVTFPIYATQEIDLVVNFINGGGVSEDTIRYTITSATGAIDHITVAGTKDAVDAIAESSITLATIDLATVRDGDQLTYAIPLADELTNISGVTEVTVTIDLPDNLVTETFYISEFNFINCPEGWTATSITQVLPVELRGISSLMANVSLENIRVVADLSGVNTVSGQHTVPVTIYLDSAGSSSEIGVLGAESKIVVSLSEGE